MNLIFGVSAGIWAAVQAWVPNELRFIVLDFVNQHKFKDGKCKSILQPAPNPRVFTCKA